MKKFVLLVMMLIAATSFGAMVESETIELGIDGMLDFDNPEGHAESILDLSLGYFFWDDIEVGGLLGFRNNGSDFGLGLGAFGEFIFDVDFAVAPFIPVSMSFNFGDYYPDDHLLIELGAGLKCFVTEYLAVNLAFIYSLASEDVFINNEKAENYDLGLRAGLSCYF